MILRTSAPGKVNLCLYVGAPRPDGYHPLVSVFQSVSLADEVKLESDSGAGTLSHDAVVCPGVEGPNLAARAIAAYREATGWDGPPVRVSITKRVPVAAGMGGGSADAAAVLRLLAELTGVDAPPGLAVTLGADVSFQMRPGRALVTGIGEHVEPLPPGPPPALVIVPSPNTLSTAAVYGEFDRLGVFSDLSDVDVRRSVNDLQDAALSLCPEIDERLERLTAAGAGDVLVAGSGPTVFGTFDDPGRAVAAAAVLPGALAVEPVPALP